MNAEGYSVFMVKFSNDTNDERRERRIANLIAWLIMLGGVVGWCHAAKEWFIGLLYWAVKDDYRSVFKDAERFINHKLKRIKRAYLFWQPFT
jgi:hypothetical protein